MLIFPHSLALEGSGFIDARAEAYFGVLSRERMQQLPRVGWRPIVATGVIFDFVAIELVPAGGDATLILSGDFDAAAASQVCAACDRLAQTDPTRTIVLDFCRVRSVADVALAALVQYQPHVPCRLRVRGLSRHHNRLLHYLRSDALDG